MLKNRIQAAHSLEKAPVKFTRLQMAKMDGPRSTIEQRLFSCWWNSMLAKKDLIIHNHLYVWWIMLAKTYIFSRTFLTPKYRELFTNIQLMLANILYQHTYEFLFKFFTNIHLYQHTENSSPTYFVFINITTQPWANLNY